MWVNSDNKAYKKPIGPAWQEKQGYWCIWIPGKNGKRGRKVHLHRLIYEQAYGPIPLGHVVHHEDEGKSNCALSNLRCLSASAHMSRHKQGLRPSHIVLPDGTTAKRCRLCDTVKPLKNMVAYKTPTGGRAYKPHCKRCHYWTYGWGKWLREHQACCSVTEMSPYRSVPESEINEVNCGQGI